MLDETPRLQYGLGHMDTPELTTERLLLRAWNTDDAPVFAALNADPRIMEFFPGPLSGPESDALVARFRAHFSERGFGMWAVERRDTGAFIGFIGLSVPDFTAPFTPCVEVGWRLDHAAWGHGYATEGARAALRFGFQTLDLPEIVAMTVPTNTRSRRVMEKLRMHCDPSDDFEHPRVPAGHPLRPHVLYRLAQKTWRSARNGRA